MHQIGITVRCALAAALTSALVAASSFGASLNYGNFGPVTPGVLFQGVTESATSDPVPLYGPPSPFSVGLGFNPIGFASYANAAASDTTKGTLDFVMSASSSSIHMDSISIAEAGDYTFAGTGTAATTASAAALLKATVLEINGSPVIPFNLAPANASVAFSMPGSVTVQPWGLGITLNIQAQLLGLGYTPNDVATSIAISIDNTLATNSQATSAASIAKKNFDVGVQVSTVAPEPASVLLTAFACVLAALRRR